MKMIFGKRQLVLSAMVLVLGGAIWLNWKFANSANDFTATNAQSEQEGHYGDSQLVNSQNKATDEKDERAKDGSDKPKKDGQQQTETKKEDQTQVKQEQTTAASPNLIEKNKGKDTYFADTRLEKVKQREAKKQTLQGILSDEKMSESEKKEITQQLNDAVKQEETENKIESLIKAKGFPDCLAFLDEHSASVVVKTGELTHEQAAQIKDILLEHTGVPVEGIRIIESM